MKILLLIMILSFPGSLFAQGRASIEDRIISSTFKTLAKAFVVTADIDKLKQDNINKLNKMDEEKFRARYAKVYTALKDLPSGLRASYRITEHMTKGQVIEDIELLDKTKIYKIIDAIPDTVIAEQFRHYLARASRQLQESNLAEQIKKSWSKMIKKANPPD